VREGQAALKFLYLIMKLVSQSKRGEKEEDWFDNLTLEQLQSLERALKDSANNKLISSRDFWKSFGRKRK
jgi:hypothetical protein